MYQPVRLTVTPDQAHVLPGSSQIVTVSVRNASPIADRYHLSVSGVPADWYGLDKPSLALTPGASDQVLLTLHPPAGATTSAGTYPITVQATSEDDPKLQAAESIALEVGSSGRQTIELQPASASGTEASFTVTLVNQANAPASFILTTRNDGEPLDYQIAPDGAVEVAPGGREVISVRVRPDKRETIGETRSYAIEFRAEPRGGVSGAAQAPFLSRQGFFTYEPRVRAAVLPLWVRRMPAWGLAAAAAGTVGLVFFAGNRTGAAVAPHPAPPTATIAVASTATARPSASPTVTFTPAPALGGTAVPTHSPMRAVALPSVKTFKVQIGAHDALSVVWSTSNARTVLLNGRPVAPSGQQPVVVTGATTLLLNVTNDGGTVSQVLQLAPPPLTPLSRVETPTTLSVPVIDHFTARPDPSTGSLALDWLVTGTGIISTTINNVPVQPSGTLPLQPDGPTTYTLRSANALGAVSMNLTIPKPPPPTVTIAQLQPPTISDFSLVHNAPGQPYMLTWTTQNAASVTLNGESVGLSGSKVLTAPVQNGTFVLVAQNADGQTQSRIQVVVGGA